MKYFVLGALASGFLLYGMSMIYGATGSLDIARGRRRRSRTGQVNRAGAGLRPGVRRRRLAFKLGAVPFHMWVPDVYHGAPTAVTLLIGARARSSPPSRSRSACWSRACCGWRIDWQQMLVVLAVLSMALGNLAAIAQTNLKRMLAYSTIAHMGFMLLGLLSGVVAATRSTRPTPTARRCST